MKLLKDKNIPFQGIIAGDGPEKSEMLKLLDELDLKDNVIYLGNKSHEDLPYVFNLFDIFIFPTLVESLGLVGLEAMSCSVPVIGSNIPGLQDYIVDNENGYFFESENYDDLSNKIINFLNLPDLEKNIIKNNCLSTAMKFDSDKVSLELINRLNLLVW